MKRKYFYIPFLVILALLVVMPAAAQVNGTVKATLSVPDGEMTVGDPVELTLAVKHPAGYQVIMPQLEQEWGDFIIHSQSAPVTVSQADGMEMTQQIIDARLFAPGAFSTPPLNVTFTDGSGQTGEVIAQPATIHVASVLVEGDTQLRDIKPQAELPYLNILPWIAGGLLVALLATVLYLLLRHRSARRVLAMQDNRLPHEVALDELERIEGLALPDVGLFKEHYTLVSDCLRSYMEKQYDVPMLERTTAEIQASLKKSDIESNVAGHYLSLLDVCDLVKFSKFRPESGSAYAILSSGRQIVQATIPADGLSGESEPGDKAGNQQPNLPAGPGSSTNGTYRTKEVRA